MSQAPLSPFGYRVHLYAKPPTAERALVIGLGAAACLALIFAGPFVGSVGWAALVLVMFCIYALVMFSMVLRTGAWLEGTRLVMRSGFSRRERDLATAAVRLAADPATGMPVLIAGGPGSAPARLLLREPGGRTAEPLAPAKLHALAGAIMAGGRTDTVGDETAGQLMTLAETRPVNLPRWLTCPALASFPAVTAP